MKPLFLITAIGLTGTVLIAGGMSAYKATTATRDLTLDEAVRIALKQNAQILNAEQEIQRTRGVVIQVGAQALPHIMLDGNYSQQSRELVNGGAGGAFAAAAAGGTPSSATTAAVTNRVANTSGTTSAVLTTGAAAASQIASAATGSRSQGDPLNSVEPQATATPMPSTSGTGGGAATGGPAAAAGGGGEGFFQDKSWTISVQATQLLYSGGQVGAAIKIAKYTKDQTLYQLRDTVDTVISTVRKEFYEVLVDKALIAVQEQSVRLLESELKDQQNRYQAGTVPWFNVLRAQVELANARPDLITARNNYHLAQLRLAKTLGYESPARPYGQEPFNCIGKLGMPKREIDLATALHAARARRPFLKSQRQQILIEVQEIEVALSGYRPRVSASGGWEITNSRFSHSLGDTVNGWFFGIDGTWNIFDGFETYGNVKQAKARLEEARVSYEDAVQQVDLEVQQAWANLLQAKETIASQEKNVEEAQEALRLAQERFNAGAGTQLDVLDARTSLIKAQTTEVQARYNYNVAIAEFDRVTAADTKWQDWFEDPLTTKKKMVRVVEVKEDKKSGK